MHSQDSSTNDCWIVFRFRETSWDLVRTTRTESHVFFKHSPPHLWDSTRAFLTYIIALEPSQLDFTWVWLTSFLAVILWMFELGIVAFYRCCYVSHSLQPLLALVTFTQFVCENYHKMGRMNWILASEQCVFPVMTSCLCKLQTNTVICFSACQIRTK